MLIAPVYWANRLPRPETYIQLTPSHKRLVLLGALVATGCQGPGVTTLPAGVPAATYRVQQACPVPSEAPVPVPSPTFDPLIQRFLVTLSGAAEVPPRAPTP